MKEKKNYLFLIIHVDGRITKTIQAKAPKLEQLQAGVQGPIQEVPYFRLLALKLNDKTYAYRGQCWANEEGMLLELPVNKVATQAWFGQCPNLGQWLHGDVVFTARTTEETTNVKA